jgi:hypothetical protein
MRAVLVGVRLLATRPGRPSPSPLPTNHLPRLDAKIESRIVPSLDRVRVSVRSTRVGDGGSVLVSPRPVDRHSLLSFL